MTVLPTTIGRYQILKQLGEGRVASVYLASDPGTNGLVALKALRQNDDPLGGDLRKRFAREGRASAGLRHPNIATVHEVGESMGVLFIVREYVEGATLKEIIQERRTIPLETKLGLMEQLCEGLGYAHSLGLIQYDVSPANLLVGKDGTLTILQVGVEPGESGESRVIDAVALMSPEQITGHPIDHRSDIFAVGALMYEFLAYRPAFAGDLWSSSVIQQILNGQPAPLEAFVPEIDRAVAQIVNKALEKNRDNRYQSLEHMRADLAECRENLAAHQKPRRDEPPASPPIPVERVGEWPIDNLTFDVEGLVLDGDTEERRMWRSSDGVLTIVNFFPQPPEWTFDLTDADACAAFFVEQFGAVMATTVATIAGHETLQCLFKFRATETSLGLSYLAIVFIPFADAYFRVRVLAREQGTTSVREARVTNLSLQNAAFPASSDDELYDRMFPDHPLTLVRARLRQVVGSLALAGVGARKPFRRA